MKKIMIGMILMAMMIASGAFAQGSPGFSNLEVVSTIYEPFPAEPGKYIDLYVKVENKGTRIATNTVFELMPKYPFSMDPEENPVKSFGNLETGQPVLLKYRVKVDQNAFSGKHNIDLRYSTGANGVWFTVPFEIEVKSRDAILSIEKVMSDPEEITAGSRATVKFTLKNLANTQIKDISLKLDMSGTTLPFAPLDSTTEKKIQTLGAGAIQTVSFNIITDASAEPKVYKIPLIMTYTDEAGTTITKSDIIGLLVSSRPELEVYMEESDKFQGGMTGNIVISVSNIGATQAKFVSVSLEKSPNYEIISPDRMYIGNLDSDDFDTVEYNLHVDESLNDTKIPVIVTLTYKDAYNKEHVKQYDLSLKVYSL
ncbi:MAG: COG1361 S-layer family protein, partial [archaeon]